SFIIYSAIILIFILSLHDALPIFYFCRDNKVIDTITLDENNRFFIKFDSLTPGMYSFKHEPYYQYVYFDKNDSLMVNIDTRHFEDRKSTRLNSSHVKISYAVFCLK